MSWTDCDDLLRITTKRCTGECPSPTPCPNPSGPPPANNCLWIKSSCRWACGLIADISRQECEASGWYWNFAENWCQSTPPSSGCETPNEVNCMYACDDEPLACDPGSAWSRRCCRCVCAPSSPVLVDLEGDGFSLTDGARGVRFDLDSDGLREPLSWTAAGSDDAWLALDRDGNGRIDDGRELFGNYTAQPPSPEPHGFIALAEFDHAERGGNGDGVIDRQDAVFTSLLLWRDANHDGVSGASELHTLPALGVAAIDLKYKESKRVDERGNEFRYRARVRDERGAQVGRWAWDVFFLPGR